VLYFETFQIIVKFLTETRLLYFLKAEFIAVKYMQLQSDLPAKHLLYEKLVILKNLAYEKRKNFNH